MQLPARAHAHRTVRMPTEMRAGRILCIVEKPNRYRSDVTGWRYTHYHQVINVTMIRDLDETHCDKRPRKHEHPSPKSDYTYTLPHEKPSIYRSDVTG